MTESLGIIWDWAAVSIELVEDGRVGDAPAGHVGGDELGAFLAAFLYFAGDLPGVVEPDDRGQNLLARALDLARELFRRIVEEMESETGGDQIRHEQDAEHDADDHTRVF